MFGLNEREAARKSSMKENLRGFLFKGISLLGDFNPTGNVFPLKYVYSQMIFIVLVQMQNYFLKDLFK